MRILDMWWMRAGLALVVGVPVTIVLGLVSIFGFATGLGGALRAFFQGVGKGSLDGSAIAILLGVGLLGLCGLLGLAGAWLRLGLSPGEFRTSRRLRRTTAAMLGAGLLAMLWLVWQHEYLDLQDALTHGAVVAVGGLLLWHSLYPGPANPAGQP
jgi:hypothetical protein